MSGYRANCFSKNWKDRKMDKENQKLWQQKATSRKLHRNRYWDMKTRTELLNLCGLNVENSEILKLQGNPVLCGGLHAYVCFTTRSYTKSSWLILEKYPSYDFGSESRDTTILKYTRAFCSSKDSLPSENKQTKTHNYFTRT